MVLTFSDRKPLEEMERSITGLTRFAGNPECLSSILDGLSGCIKNIVSVLQEGNDNSDIEKAITGLFAQIIQVRTFITLCRYYDMKNYYNTLPIL